MTDNFTSRNRMLRTLAASLVVAGATTFATMKAEAADPIRIGLSLSLTGPTAAAGKQVLAGLEIWRDDINAKGGLLDRPVQLVYYDDQGTPANAPGIYAKLMSVDKVELLIGPYSTNVIAAAMPAIIQNKRTTIGIFGLGANGSFKYPKYFSMNSQGQSTSNYSKCVFDLAAQQNPKPTRIALIGADAEYSRNALDGAKANAKAMGMEIVFDRTYPLSTTDYTSIVRAMAATKPDVVFYATLPVDTVGLIKASTELKFKPKMVGGAMLGLLVTGIKQNLGEQINGYISNEFYIPAPSLQFDGTAKMMKDYQAKAGAAGIDPLGFTYPPYAYAAGQILAKAVTETKSLDDDKLGAYLRDNSFDTVIGPVKFGENGEWTTPRIICIQFQGIQGGDLAQFSDWNKQVVVYPDQYKSGKLQYPLE
ncbi:MAG: amino acid ABC transporter substrate-binding protein [Pseudolabrys sp.]|nr:amino acid ABC transporter substrate-binding protein [Pseudolabrys sp.]